MYEMAAGRLAFSGATTVDTLVSILEKEPPPLDRDAPEVPTEFQRIINKALRKDREGRYQTITDLLIDLKSLKEELSFEQKLERSRPSGASASVEPATSEPATTPVQITQPTRIGNKRVIAVVGVVLASLLLGGGTMLWRRGASTPAIPAPVRPAERALSYWITVQKYRDGKPYQDPFRLRDDINFEKDYRIRLNIMSSQSGRLYLLNEGPEQADQTPSFIVLFPSETANSGSAQLGENQEIQIPQQSWFQFDEQQGTEKIWVVWAEKDVLEIEAVKGFANHKNRGMISSPGLRTAVNEFLRLHSSSSPTVERDQEKKETVVKANSGTLVHVIRLEHH
jgi:serine/threonine protein kinase